MTNPITWKRTLRTASSERFLAIRNGRDAAAIELHYLPNGTVSGTVILLEDDASNGSTWSEADVPELLRSLDEDFLPDVDLTAGTLTYTVVIGRVVGNYEASIESVEAPRK